MTLAKVKNLYDQDFALWIEKTVKQLKSGDLSQVDLENLIEEVESLGRRDKRELKNRLITLFEQALKRRYLPLSDCYRGWEVTIKRCQSKLKDILKDSPSLCSFLPIFMIIVIRKRWRICELNMMLVFPIFVLFLRILMFY